MTFAPTRFRRMLAVLAVVPLLASCAGIVAIPLVAGGALYARNKIRVAAATRVPQQPRSADVDFVASSASPGEAGYVLTNLTELPKPAGLGAGVDDPWAPFVDFALAQGEVAREADRPQSALIIPSGALSADKRRPCTARHPAVILDLDKAQAALAPQHVTGAAPGLAVNLARLREAGIVVLWISQLPSSSVVDVANVLRASGLDPEGRDQLLLVRNPEDRKQQLREQANEDVCIVAIAGDQRSDFDELFDFLRDPDSALGLELMMGNGWFLTPVPVETP